MPSPRVAVVARAVFPLHGFGGLERHVADLVRHLDASGADVTLIVPPPRGDVATAPERPGPDVVPSRVRVLHVPYVSFPFAGRRGTTILDRDTAYPLFGMRAGRRALALVHEGAVDVVHGLGASVLGYARARATGRAAAPLVFNPQGLEEFGATSPAGAGLKRLAYWPLQRAVLACAGAADRILATDTSLVPVVERHLRVSGARVTVVPNAVDLEACDRFAGSGDARAARTRLGIAWDAPVFLTVGRVEENKGLHVLARALRGVRESPPPGLPASWRWVHVGDGPYRPALVREIAAAGVDSHMIWAGRLSDADLHAWYEAATVFVHPTLYEGSSLVTLEAMAHRRAIVATRAGGLPDKVAPGVNGWLVAPGDPPALATALAEAIAAGPALDAMGLRSREIVEQRFAWPAVAAQTLQVYAELLEAGKKKDGRGRT